MVGNDPVQTHDEFGLPMDMALYADAGCKRCNGTGSYIVHRQLAEDEVERMFGSIVDKRMADAGFDTVADDRRRRAMLRVQASRHTARAVENCACALKVYGKARDYVAQQSRDRKSSSS